MKRLNALVIGTGGVGTIVALGIHQTALANISVVVRSDYQRVSKNGYTIESVDYGTIRGWKPESIYSSVEEAGKSGQVFDYVILVTKNLPDIAKPEILTGPVITPVKTTIVLMQNGFDLGQPFIKKYPKNVCLSGVSHIGSHNEEGIVKQTGTDKAVISYFDNFNLTTQEQESKAKEFISIYSNEKNNIIYFPNAKLWRYRKLVYNATLNTVCALTGLDTGRLEQAGVLASVSVPAMREVYAVAKADGCELPEGIVDEIAHCEPGYFEPSMLVDIKKGNPIELEVILGNFLKTAKSLNVETPVLSLVYELLKGIQFKIKEQKGLVKVPKTKVSNTDFYSDK